MKNIEEDLEKYGYIQEHKILQYDHNDLINKIHFNGLRKKIIISCPNCKTEFGFFDLAYDTIYVCPECGLSFTSYGNLDYKTVYTDKTHFKSITDII